MEQSYRRRIVTENILIGLLGALALLTLAASFFPAAPLSGFLMHVLVMKAMTSRVFAVVLLIALYHLYQRKRMAWRITVVLLLLNFIRHLLPPHLMMFLVIAVLEGICLCILFVLREDFCCPSEKSSVKRGIVLLIPVVAAIVLNAGISYHVLKAQLAVASHRVLLWESMKEAGSILLGTTNSNAVGFPNVRFENFMFVFTWVCIVLALLYSFRPWIERFFWTEHAMQRAREIVLRYGQNASSYLTLEDDKLLYFSKCATGVVPYGVVGSTVIVNGDPICAPEDFSAVLAEWKDFCQKSNHKVVFLSITGQFLEEYRKQGFGTVKCGEEARFDVQSYDITGKKGAKMRMNINHATKAGLIVREYKPNEARDTNIEAAMERITQEWLSDKKSGLLTFTMGTLGLERPLDRRYFYACDEQGHIYGYNVYCPFDGGAGYMADITRRSHDAPGGITEKIMYEAFQVFKQEAVRTVSLGIAPLANIVREGEHANGIEKLLQFVYEHLNSCYGFKNLYRAKENYSPTEWLPGYYAWLPKLPAPEVFYAVVRIQNQQGVKDFARAYLKARHEVDARE